MRYHWHEEISESFGRILRPIAEIHIKDKNSIWRAISMYVDSGADISIVSRDFGELFGHKVEKGKQIKLKGISDAHIIAYIHKMEMLIGKHEIPIEVAIAINNEVPNVIGRRGIFDLFEIQFKNKKQQTWFLRK